MTFKVGDRCLYKSSAENGYRDRMVCTVVGFYSHTTIVGEWHTIFNPGDDVLIVCDGKKDVISAKEKEVTRIPTNTQEIMVNGNKVLVWLSNIDYEAGFGEKFRRRFTMIEV